MTTIPAALPRAVAPALDPELTSARPRSLEVLLTGFAIVAAAAHVPAIPPHLQEAPYMGVLFVLLAPSMIICAYGILTRSHLLWRAAATGLAVTAVVGYCLTRIVAFPLLADDVGNWFEPLGVASVVAELGVIATGVAGSGRGRSSRQPLPSG